jgi:hypothetical protein
MNLSKVIRVLLSIAALWCGAELSLRCLRPQVLWPIAFKSPLNLSAFAAISCIALCLFSGALHAREESQAVKRSNRKLLGWIILILICCSAIFYQVLHSPFLSDDYNHLAAVSHANVSFLKDTLIRAPGDRTFRPLGFWSYYLDAHWAAWEPLRWHAINLLLHLVNCVLVFLLAREMGFNTGASIFALAFFAFQGAHYEPVAWLAARFDLWATLFVLLGILLFLKWEQSQNLRWLLASLLCCALALLSKESAYCFPLLLIIVMTPSVRPWSKKGIRLLLPYFLVTALIFAYRWMLVGGIGGYQQNGESTILNFHLLLTAKALLLRMWAILWVPLNWSDLPGPVIAALLFLNILAIVWLGFHTLRNHWTWRCILFTIIAAIPAEHLLLLDSTLAGARYLYLPSAGAALFFGSLMPVRASKSKWLCATTIVVFQAVALIHNLRTWQDVANLSFRTCEVIGDTLKKNTGKVAVDGVPGQIKGVYFFANGLQECAEHMAPGTASRLILGKSDFRKPTSTLRWNPLTQRLDCQ